MSPVSPGVSRFQRAKYLARIVEVRQELAGWLATYRTIQLPENQFRFTPRQIAVAEKREGWVEDLVNDLEELEEKLAEEPED